MQRRCSCVGWPCDRREVVGPRDDIRGPRAAIRLEVWPLMLNGQVRDRTRTALRCGGPRTSRRNAVKNPSVDFRS